MLDVLTRTSQSGKPRLQRTRGRAFAGFVNRGDKTHLARLHQSGSAKAFLPRTHGPVPELVFLNTAGGVTGGDALEFGAEIAPGCSLCATTQTAERAYASLGDAAHVNVTFSVGDGGHLNWLPQETIIFDAASLHRKTRIDLAGTASALMCETLVLGRSAMGETVSRVNLLDHREIRRDGRPLFLDPVRLDDARLSRGASAAILGDARTMGTVVLVAENADTRLGPLRQILAQLETSGCKAAASAWDGRLVLRVLAQDAFDARRLMAEAIAYLTDEALPRVWQI